MISKAGSMITLLLDFGVLYVNTLLVLSSYYSYFCLKGIYLLSRVYSKVGTSCTSTRTYYYP